MSQKFIHIVLISFHEQTPEDVRKEIYEDFQTLGERCGGKDAGILFWKVEKNLDLRKNVHLVQLAIFENDDAFQRYRAHAAHTEIANKLKEAANWQVGQFHTNLPL